MNLGNPKSSRILRLFVLVTFALTLAGIGVPAQAQTYTDLHDFNPGVGDPHNFVESKLAQGRDGNLYTESNGGRDFREWYRLQFLTHRDADCHPQPRWNGWVECNRRHDSGTDGDLYGDTWSGGTFGNGITFKITPGAQRPRCTTSPTPAMAPIQPMCSFSALKSFTAPQTRRPHRPSTKSRPQVP
jgi:hypothetical protein